MAPEWNGAARGVFYGLTLAHTRAHMTPALLEAPPMPCATSSRAWATPAWTSAASRSSAAGPRPLWRQIKADVTGLPVRVPTSVETTATGPPSTTAVGAGVHTTVAEAVDAFVAYQPDEHVPTPSATRSTARPTATTDVYFALKPVFER